MSKEKQEPTLLLTADERLRFTLWLEREIQTNTELATQLFKLGSPANRVLGTKYQSEANACKVVAELLRNIHVVGV